MGKYLIGDFSRHTGLTPEALKHYEKYGLIEFTRDEKNGYRYCDFSQIHNLVAISHAQSGNRSLRHSHDYERRLQTREQICDELRLIEAEARREQVFRRYLEKNASKNLDMLNEYKDNVGIGSISIPDHDLSLSLLRFAKDYQFLDRSAAELEGFSTWRRAMGGVNLSILLAPSSSEAHENYHALVTTGAFADEYGLPQEHAVAMSGRFLIVDLVAHEEDMRAVKTLEDVPYLNEFVRRHLIPHSKILVVSKLCAEGISYNQVFILLS